MYDLPSWRRTRRAIHSRLLQSSIVNLIGLSRSGRSSLLKLIVDDWRGGGFSAVVVDSALTPDAFRGAAQKKLQGHEPWLVAVDDFDVLLNGRGGGQWNDVLNGHCVNVRSDEKAPAVILVSDSRFSLLDLPRRSLIADAITDTVSPPQITVDDLMAVGWNDDEAARRALEEYGCFPRLLLESMSGAVDPKIAESAFLSAVPGVTGALSQRLRQLSRRTDVRSQPHALDGHLAPLLVSDGPKVMCAAGFVKAGCARLVEGADQFWPRDLDDSAKRFASRLFMSTKAIWLDRYIGPTPRQLIKFLGRVAEIRGAFELRILSERSSVSDVAQVNRQLLKSEFSRLSAAGFTVLWKTLHPNDVRRVHARQLVFPNIPGIYHLPPVDRLLDTSPVGNEVDAFISKSGDWESVEHYWSRSSDWL
ncbi:hypothetical protein ACFY03_22315 [Micromonospora chersina]|uniref:hypothetical protein n=1 Tax=Micromonospora chersina TaxID=47854 RepID=UPI003676736A